MPVITKGMTDVPFYVDKKFKASMTGITHLKDYSYKSRHMCGPGQQSLPDGSIIKKPPIKKDDAKLKSRNKGRNGHSTDLDALLSPDPGSDSVAEMAGIPERPPFEGYTLKKQVIRNRILNYANVMRSDRRWKKPVMYFWTVTFPEGTPDDTCYQLFNTWLTTLRAKKMLHSYLWVAERQPKKTKTIHFHILIPHYMGVQRANGIMKQSICNAIRKGTLSNWNLHAAKRYNGVDIDKNRKTKKVVNFAEHGKQRSLARYLTKYVTKNETKLYRLPWHCSRDWSAMIVGVALTREEVARFISGKNLDPNKLAGEYCDFYRWRGYPPERLQNYLGWMNYNMLFHIHGGPPDEIFSKN